MEEGRSDDLRVELLERLVVRRVVKEKGEEVLWVLRFGILKMEVGGFVRNYGGGCYGCCCNTR